MPFDWVQEAFPGASIKSMLYLMSGRPCPTNVQIYGDGQARRAAYEARVSRSRRNHFHHNISGCGADAGGGNSNGGAAAGVGSGASRCA